MPKHKTFWDRYQKIGDCWIWQGSGNPRGYGQVSIKGKLQLVHRIAWILIYGEIPEGLRVCHRCDNRRCINPKHLFLGTDTDNVKDMWQKDRNNHKGEHNPFAKLTDEEVRQIKKLLSQNEPVKKIANLYNVKPIAIYHIKEGHNWSHIKSTIADRK